MPTIDPALHQHVATSFAPLNKQAFANSFPRVASLSEELTRLIPRANVTLPAPVKVSPKIAALFTTAAVEMWQRSVHSFLISASLTRVSPIWAAVCGYYSSHYAVRASAHLLGHFQLYRKRLLVKLSVGAGGPLCTFSNKKDDREHRFYWKVVKEHSYFAGDDFFTANDSGQGESDVGHRDRVSYVDHLMHYPKFKPLSAVELSERIDTITKIEMDTAPIPQIGKCPDVESTQLIAYYRLVAFRKLVDEILGGKNRFWQVQRDPPWAKTFLNFQLVASPSVLESVGQA